MRRRALLSGIWVCLAALAVLLVPPAVAQQATTVSVLSRTAEIDGLLREGRQFESQRRWGEALTHYEDALRLFPGEQTLERRFELSRVHYDLGRRYADRSFLAEMVQMPPEEALELYGQVLLKIEAHYVEAPNWKQLLEGGTENFQVALSEPLFLKRNLPRADQAAISGLCGELRRVLQSRAISSRNDARDAVADAAELAERRSGISPTVVVLEYLCGAANMLDPYSAYLTPNQLDEVYSQIEGNFVGLGIELKVEDGALLIVRVIAGSPAAQSGIRAGDRILSIDGRSTRDLSTDEAADRLQGEAGSVVELDVVTGAQEPRRVSVGRRRVEVPSVDEAKILDSQYGVAYLRLACFQKTTCRDLETALWKLYRAGMRRLIIDLRGNPGGLLLTAVEAADKFIDRGIIVSTRGRSLQEDFTYSAHAAGTWRVPLVVLIDRDSASAAEIFAGAIRDHRRGTVVGVRSYGKGSVQGIFALKPTGAGVRLTTAKFYSPAGRPYSRLGVQPDVVVHLAARPVEGRIALPATGEDAMLAAAVQAARRIGRPAEEARLLRWRAGAR